MGVIGREVLAHQAHRYLTIECGDHEFHYLFGSGKPAGQHQMSNDHTSGRYAISIGLEGSDLIDHLSCRCCGNPVIVVSIGQLEGYSIICVLDVCEVDVDRAS